MRMIDRYFGSSVRSPDEGGASPAPASTVSISPPASSGTPSSTPSPTPSVTTTPSVTPTAPSTAAKVPQASESFNYDEIFQIDETPDVAPVVAAPAAPKAVPVPAVAAPQDPLKPPGGVEPPKQVEAAPVVQQPVVAREAGPQEASPPPSPADPGRMAQLLLEHEPAAIQHIADTVFKLSNEEIEALETNAVETIPKLMARAFIKAQQSTLQHLARSVPAMFEQYLQVKSSSVAAEREFFGKFPQISSKEHGDLVKRIATTYRQANPSASREQMIADVGAMVMQLAKIPAVTAAPTGTLNGNGVRPPQSSPFTPAGAGVVAAPQQVEAQAWDILDPNMDR